MSVQSIRDIRANIFCSDDLDIRIWNLIKHRYPDGTTIDQVEEECRNKIRLISIPGFGRKSLNELTAYVAYLRKHQEVITDRDEYKTPNPVMNLGYPWVKPFTFDTFGKWIHAK